MAGKLILLRTTRLTPVWAPKVGPRGRRYGGAGGSASAVLPTPALVWLDPADLTTLRQEITGAGASTMVTLGQPVGSILNKGTVGGWVTAPSDAARPILAQYNGKYCLEVAYGGGQSMQFPSAMDNTIAGQQLHMAYAVMTTASGTIIGGQGSETNQNFHTGIGGSGDIVFAMFGNNLAGGSGFTGAPVVVVGQGTNVGRRIRANGVQIASDSVTDVPTNGGYSLFIGPLGDGGGPKRLFSLVIRQSATTTTTIRNEDEQYCAATCGQSFTST